MDTGVRGVVSSRPFLMGLLRKAEIDEDIMDDVADACAVNRFTAASLASQNVAISVVADKLFLTDEEATKLIRVCEAEVGSRVEEEGENAVSEDSEAEGGVLEREEKVNANGTETVGRGPLRCDAFRLEEGPEDVASKEGSSEAEHSWELPAGDNDDGPSSPVQIQVQVQIRSPDPPQELEEEVNGPNTVAEEFELEHEGEEEYGNEGEELNYTLPVEGDASSDATSPFVATSELEPTTPDADVALDSRRAFLAPAGVASGGRSFTDLEVAPNEEIGDSSDLYSPELVQRVPEDDNAYGSMPASKSLENLVVSPAMTAQDDFLASDNEGSDGPASSRTSTNFNATRQHLHSTTSSIIMPESQEGTPPRVQSMRVTTPGRTTVPALRLNNHHQPSSKAQVLSSSGASVDTTSGLHSTEDRSAGGTRLSGRGEVDPPMNLGQFGRAREPFRRRVFTPTQTPRRESSYSRQPFDGPSYQRPTVASEARRRAVEASKAAAAAKNEGWGRDDYRNRPQSGVGRPSSGQSTRRPLSARPPRRPPSASILRPTQAFLARQACNSRNSAAPSPTWRPSSRGREFGFPPAVVEQSFRGNAQRVVALRRKIIKPLNEPSRSPEDPQN